MAEFPEARIALCKCGKSQKIHGVRFERYQTGWKYTWAFPIKEGSAKRENYDSTILKSDLIRDENYPGCPECGALAFMICSGCGKLNCNLGVPKCNWCGYGDSLSDYDGSGVRSDIDR